MHYGNENLGLFHREGLSSSSVASCSALEVAAVEELSLVGDKPVGPYWVTRTRNVHGYLVAATRIWTGEALPGAAAEGSGRALRSPAYGGWGWGWGGEDDTAHQPPPQGCPASWTLTCVTSTPAPQVDAPKQQRILFPHDLWDPSTAVSTGT